MQFSNIIFIQLILLTSFSQCNKKANPTFKKQIIHNEFIAEGVAVADVNKDGKTDILSGAFWFEAPDWEKHEIVEPKDYDYSTGYSDYFLAFTTDVDQDGWEDLIQFGFPGNAVFWYKNPQGADQHWEKTMIDTNACNESPIMADVNGDGIQELIFGHESTQEMMWFQSPNGTQDKSWQAMALSTPGSTGSKRYDHGLGIGDVNKDGRNDVITRYGWWEAPNNYQNTPWRFHKANLGLPVSQMHSFDFDDDGDNDILAASAHAYGIWWYEQEDGGKFSRHLIDSTFSQTHGSALKDMNGDGLPDFITGKRFFAHQGKDPGGLEPALIYWFELQRDKNNQPKWIPHLIDDDSGAGLQVVVEDLNGDGKLDILNSNKKGLICFWQE